MSEDDDDDDGDGATVDEVNDDSNSATGDGATGYDDNDNDGGGMTGNEVDNYGEGATGDDDGHDGTERCNNQIEATAGGNNSHRRSTAESNEDKDNEVGADESTMYDDKMMVAANNDCGRGGRCPSCRRWRLEVVLPFPTLSTSRNDGREARRASHGCRAKISAGGPPHIYLLHRVRVFLVGCCV